ncbi:RUXE protein, partial [Alcedo cyanopectus]|nr:RUXE protein [Ceyx cyanopectus]
LVPRSQVLGVFLFPFHSSSSSLQRSRIQVWLYEQVNMRIEGCIIGFDEYMNLVLDDAEEIHSKTKARKQ